jgi:hypothetical protein
MSWIDAEGNSHNIKRGENLRSEYSLLLPIFRYLQYILLPEDERKSFTTDKIMILYIILCKFIDKIF